MNLVKLAMTKEIYIKFRTSLNLLIHGQKRLAVAVSGGSDSMALALLLSEYATESNSKIIAITVDHGLRAESKGEAAQVCEWLASYNIKHYTLCWEGEKKSSNLQANARKARYQLMANFCSAHNISTLLVAHTSNDQAETVLMRLMRGSGVDGLSGIPTKRVISNNVSIVRPLLHFTREELRTYLLNKKQEWLEDPSNKNTKFTRIQVRNLIQESPNPELLTKRLSDTAGHMARTRKYIEEKMRESLEGVAVFYKEGFYSIDIVKFKKLHEEERLRFLTKALQHVSGQEYKPRFENLLALHNNIISGNIKAACTLWGCEISPSKKLGEENYLFIYREPKAVEADIEISNPQFFWDNRFECVLGSMEAKNIRAGALGKEGYNQLINMDFKIDLSGKERDFIIPKKVIYSLATLKTADNKILAVPQIGYYTSEELRDFTCKTI